MKLDTTISKRRRLWPRLVGIALVVLAGLYAIPRLVTTARYYGQIHEPSLDAELVGLDAMMPSKDGEMTSFHLGLPHPYFEGSDFLWAVWLSPTRNFHGYRFRYEEWTPGEAFRNAVRETLSRREVYKGYAPANCGGFHADFVAEFTTSDGVGQLMVCLSCGDVLLFGPGGARVSSLSREAHKALTEAWKAEFNLPL